MRTSDVRMIIFIVTGCAACAPPALASGRATGMGGACVAVPDPALLGRDNPATLGIADNRGFRLNLFGAAVELGNSAYGIADYNRYNGATWSEADKAEILARLGDDGLELSGLGRGFGPGLGVGPVAVSMGAVGMAGGRIPAGVLELLLEGNPVDEAVLFDGAAGGGWAAIEGAVACGLSIGERVAGGETTVGLRARYLHGLYAAGVTHASGRVVTTTDTLYGHGRLEVRTARGGSGYALDLGVLHHTGDLNIGFRWIGALASMSWRKDPELRTYTVEAGLGDIFDEGDVPEPETTETTEAIGAFRSRPPMRLGVGAALQRGRWVMAGDLEHTPLGLVVGEDPWRLSCGVERALLGGHVRPRAGARMGDASRRAVTGGISFTLGPWRLDLDAGTTGTFNPFSPRGCQVAMGSALIFG